MVTPEEREFLWATYAPEPRMRLNLGIRRRLAPLLDGDRRKLELANSILFTLPGAPIVYYGDEIGMGDNIWLNDRDGVRTPMQWDAGPNAGFTGPDVPPERLYAPVVDDPQFGYRRVNVQAQRADPGSLWHALRRMIAVRKSQPALSRGDCDFLPLRNHAVLAVARTHGRDTVLALHNLTGQAQRIGPRLARWQGAAVRDLLKDEALPRVSGRPYRLTLAPYEHRWLRLEIE
jgi:maltose alpha-D-glucosyltransferase/alpha-amylase